MRVCKKKKREISESLIPMGYLFIYFVIEKQKINRKIFLFPHIFSRLSFFSDYGR